MQDKPDKDIAEITIIGTGGGYGESCVIHLGNDEWVVIDSCCDPNNKESLPVNYLRKIGVNIATDVKLIICTHWHMDHILGLSQLYEESKNARFCYGRVLDFEKFKRFVGYDQIKGSTPDANSTTSEFSKCLQILRDRNENILGAYPDRTLKRVDLNSDNSIYVYSLSPSDNAMELFDFYLANNFEMVCSSNVKLPVIDPNHCSIAIFFEFGKHKAILGGDLEVTNDPKLGWDEIISNTQTLRGKSNYFKVSHHGSENGYHSRIWDLYVSTDPTITMTPWNRGSKLPTKKMVETYMAISKDLYITSLSSLSEKPKKRDKSIEKMISQFKFNLQEVKFNFGIIRSRINILDSEDKWHVECFGAATIIK